MMMCLDCVARRITNEMYSWNVVKWSFFNSCVACSIYVSEHFDCIYTAVHSVHEHVRTSGAKTTKLGDDCVCTLKYAWTRLQRNMFF